MAAYGGDIWSTGAFSFESPLKDLLDSGSYTVEQLLAEDELLQEIRGRHQTLIDFLSTEESVSKLVHYIFFAGRSNAPINIDVSSRDDPANETQVNESGEPNNVSIPGDDDGGMIILNDDRFSQHKQDITAPDEMNIIGSASTNKSRKPGEWIREYILDDVPFDGNSSTEPISSNLPIYTSDMTNIRFPYMACEIICCEIPSVLDCLVHGKVAFAYNYDDEDENYNKKDDTFNTDNRAVPTTEIVTTCDSDDVEVISASVSSTSNSSYSSTTDADSLNKGSNEDTIDPSKSDQGVATGSTKDYSKTILDYMFSVLFRTKPGQLDDYRAGYLDKILTVLFRNRPDELTLYINGNRNFSYRTADGSTSIMRALLQHLYSPSIMQIAQRLLIPPKPAGKVTDGGNNGDAGDDTNMVIDDNMVGNELIITGAEDDDMAGNNGNDIGQVRCDWYNSTEAIDLLLDMLTGLNDKYNDEEQILDLSLNASEVLITIIQNSMLSSSTMLTLTQADTVLRIINAATVLKGDYFSPHETLLTSSMNVLESLILQLGGYGAVGTMSLLPADSNTEGEGGTSNNGQHYDMIDLSDPTNVNSNYRNNTGSVDLFRSDSEEDDHQSSTQNHPSLDGQQQHSQDETTCMDDVDMEGDDKHLIADLGSILEHLPYMLDNFTKLLLHPSTRTWKSAMQYSRDADGEQLLGNSRLRIIRVLESLVLLGDPDVDAILVQQSLCIEICLKFFWQFQWCSMLHQSVANLLVHVFEGQNTRYEMQDFFLNKCNLLQGLMNSFMSSSSSMIMVMNADNVKVTDSEGRGSGYGNAKEISEETPVLSPKVISQEHTELDVVAEEHDSYLQSAESERNAPIVEGIALNDTTEDVLIESKLAQLSISEERNDNSPLPVSEDDIDAAMEGYRRVELNQDALMRSNDEVTGQQGTTVSRQGSFTEGALGNDAIPLAQSFRCGYMGHVIIICQALVNAYMQDDPQRDASALGVMQEEDEQVMDGSSPNQTRFGESNVNGDMYTGPKDDFGDPLLLADLVSQHPLAERWHEFVLTTLSSENAIQSTPQGAYSMQTSTTVLLDQMLSHRPGLIDEGYMMGDDGDGPPAPPNRSGALIVSDTGDVIDMDDNDLDIAASMMAGLSLSHSSGNPLRRNRNQVTHRVAHNDLVPEDNDDSGSYGSGSADSEKSYNSGETANDRTGYAFDDPLGKAGGLGIELGKLTQYYGASAGRSKVDRRKATEDEVKADGIDEAATDNCNNSGSDDGSHSSASSDDESCDRKELDVPVMDLFAGNFTFDAADGSTSPVFSTDQKGTADVSDFADFANFDNADIALDLTQSTTSGSGVVVGIVKPDLEMDDAFAPFKGEVVVLISEDQNQATSISFDSPDALAVEHPENPADDPSLRNASELDDLFGGPKDHLSLLEAEDLVKSSEANSSQVVVSLESDDLGNTVLA